MKTLFTALMILAAFTGFCQSTTEEEYRYMLKGYEATVANGLDVKTGYEVNPFHEIKKSNATIKFLQVLRRDQSFVGFIVIITDPRIARMPTYIVIPAASDMGKPSYGWDRFEQNLQNVVSCQVKDQILLWMAAHFVAGFRKN